MMVAIVTFASVWHGGDWRSAAAALTLGSAAWVILALRLHRLRETTLVAPWCWTVGAIAALVAAELAGASYGVADAAWLAPLHYAAVMTVFCPTVALLGARRPHTGAWQFVVVALWVLLALPAAEGLLFRPGERVALSAAWSWLLVALLLAGAASYAATRYWPSYLLALAGQTAVVWPYLPWSNAARWDGSPLLGLAGFAVAIALAAAGVPRPAGQRFGLARVWLDFRDAYGAFWALRVLGRLRAAADLYGWNLDFGWHGPAPANPQQKASPDELAAAVQVLSGVLRRFVDPAWIAQRLKQP